MINKAIVERFIDENHVQVRIPRIHKIDDAIGATPKEELPVATICAPAGIFPTYNIGDIVLVAYDNNDYGSPVIVGSLRGSVDRPSRCEIITTNLTVDQTARFPVETSIGEVSSESLQYLSGVDDNVQKQLNTMVAPASLEWLPIE